MGTLQKEGAYYRQTFRRPTALVIPRCIWPVSGPSSSPHLVRARDSTRPSLAVPHTQNQSRISQPPTEKDQPAARWTLNALQPPPTFTQPAHPRLWTDARSSSDACSTSRSSHQQQNHPLSQVKMCDNFIPRIRCRWLKGCVELCLLRVEKC